jgi:hypothetical protein
MPPTRPVTGASIASVWGQQVHDFTFAPAGCTVSGGAVTMLAGDAYRDLPIDTAVDDPGGYADVGANRLEIPTDGDGLYLIVLWCSTDDGDAGDETGVVLRVNSTEIARAQVGNEGSTVVTLGVTALEDLSVGDLISVRARQIGGGADASVHIRRLSIVRVGAELGAP